MLFLLGLLAVLGLIGILGGMFQGLSMGGSRKLEPGEVGATQAFGKWMIAQRKAGRDQNYAFSPEGRAAWMAHAESLGVNLQEAAVVQYNFAKMVGQP